MAIRTHTHIKDADSLGIDYHGGKSFGRGVEYMDQLGDLDRSCFPGRINQNSRTTRTMTALKVAQQNIDNRLTEPGLL